jgi:hypothetical protein
LTTNYDLQKDKIILSAKALICCPPTKSFKKVKQTYQEGVDVHGCIHSNLTAKVVFEFLLTHSLGGMVCEELGETLQPTIWMIMRRVKITLDVYTRYLRATVVLK